MSHGNRRALDNGHARQARSRRRRTYRPIQAWRKKQCWRPVRRPYRRLGERLSRTLPTVGYPARAEPAVAGPYTYTQAALGMNFRLCRVEHANPSEVADAPPFCLAGPPTANSPIPRFRGRSVFEATALGAFPSGKRKKLRPGHAGGGCQGLDHFQDVGKLDLLPAPLSWPPKHAATTVTAASPLSSPMPAGGIPTRMHRKRRGRSRPGTQRIRAPGRADQQRGNRGTADER